MNNSLLNGLLIFSLFIGLAWTGEDILLPVIFAFFLWVIVTAWAQTFQKISFMGKLLPRKLQTLLSFLCFVVIIYVLQSLLTGELGRMSEVYPVLESNFMNQSQQLLELTGIDLTSNIQESLAMVDLQAVAREIADTLSSLSTTIFVVLVYLLYFFNEQKFFQAKLTATAQDKYDEQKKLMADIFETIKQYISIKTAISALTAVLSYLVMLFIGLEFAFVFAFIIFVMNFIPSIGSIIATAFPVLFSLLMFETWWQAIVLLIVIGAIQLYVGNALEPKYLGKKLNVSSLLLFFSLFFWGAIWGIPGMFLSVPLTVVIMIILSRIPATRNIGIWMSGDGVV